MAKVNRYSGFRTMTAYEAVSGWSAKRKAMRQDFEAKQSDASNRLLGAQSSSIDGMGTIIGQIALDRVLAEGKAKAAANAAAAKFATEVDTNRADIKDSKFSGSKSAQLDSGTKIDLDAGTITLSNGTVIDSKTGVKKINIVT